MLSTHRNYHHSTLRQLLNQGQRNLISCCSHMNSIELYLFVKDPAFPSVTLLNSDLLLEKIRVAILDVFD